MTAEGLPPHTFGETDLMLARDALLIVDGMVRRAVGSETGDAAVGKLHDLASELRHAEKTNPDIPDIACDWPWDDSEGVAGEMSFHVASGGSEYDGIRVCWTRDADQRLAFVYHYDGRDELYESEMVEDDG